MIIVISNSLIISKSDISESGSDTFFVSSDYFFFFSFLAWHHFLLLFFKTVHKVSCKRNCSKYTFSIKFCVYHFRTLVMFTICWNSRCQRLRFSVLSLSFSALLFLYFLRVWILHFFHLLTPVIIQQPYWYYGNVCYGREASYNSVRASHSFSEPISLGFNIYKF